MRAENRCIDACRYNFARFKRRPEARVSLIDLVHYRVYTLELDMLFECWPYLILIAILYQEKER